MFSLHPLIPRTLLVVACLLILSPHGRADLTSQQIDAIKKAAATIKFQPGPVTLKNGLATVTLPAGLSYVDPDDAVTLLTKVWQNPPPEQKPLGMIMPDHDFSWGDIITYSEDGYVKDKDADSIDYTKMLKDLQKAVQDENPERTKNGYPSLDLIGWAVPPRYDKESKTLYWAKEIKFGDDKINTLNYNIRILGRRGVLVLNAVAGMDQLAEIQDATPKILSAVNFTPGNRYADFNDSTDKIATYGIAALVAGGVAAKLGLFKILLGFLAASYKFVLLGLAASWRFVLKGINWIKEKLTGNKPNPL